MSFEEKQFKRLNFLKRLYDLVDGQTDSGFDMWEIGEELGLDQRETQGVVSWLSDEGLIESLGIGGTIGLSHYGIKQIEESIKNPNRETRYFPPINVIHIGNMNNSQLQQGTHSSTQSFNQVAADVLEKVRPAIEKLKAKISELPLEEDVRDEVELQLHTAEMQLKSKQPKQVVIIESIKTIRSLLEGTAAGLLATGILALFGLH